jgi:tRNA A-37 threonylcarbamoyl transferase component Bud32
MSSPAAAEDRIVAGRYRLRQVVGRGGMGVLWAARDEMLGRDVAVKELRPPLDAAGEHNALVRERALREARAAARVTHPSAVTVYDVVEEDERPWIVMELLSPRTLADVLAVEGPLAPGAVARIGLDLLDALTTAHQAGVLHRDVKPGNILFADGRAVLVDFGIATLDGDASPTSTGVLLGSPAFMSPERARGERPTPASDLWSLGATLFTAVEGVSPFRRDGQLPTLAAVVTQDAPPAEHAGPLRALLAGLLARDPADRPTAAQTRARLVGALSADAELTAAAPAVDPHGDLYDDLEPTAEAPLMDYDDDPDDEPVVAPLVPAPPFPGPLAALHRPWVPRPRRTRALAAALLAPIGLFALALGWPVGRADPVTAAPRAVVTAPGKAPANHSTATTATTTRTPARPASASTTRQRKAAVEPAVTSRSSSTQQDAGDGGQGDEHAKGHDGDHGKAGKNKGGDGDKNGGKGKGSDQEG